MNSPEEYITYVVVDRADISSTETHKKVKVMNTQGEERVTYIAVEPAKAGRIQTMNNAQITSSEVGSGGNLDKVRELLFGNQVRDYEKRFNRLEESLVQESEQLRDDTKKRLETLELYIKQEVESLTEWVKNKQTEQDEALQALAQEHKDTSNSLEKKLAQLDEQGNKSDRILREQILEQSKNLHDEIQQKFTDILGILEREAQELRSEKTNSATLAELLVEFAMRLKNQQ